LHRFIVCRTLPFRLSFPAIDLIGLPVLVTSHQPTMNATNWSRRALISQISRALHAGDLISLQVILVSVVLKPTTVQYLSISPVALIRNGCLPTFISQQNKLLLGVVVHNPVCRSLKQT
jgi:hypothetical protein